MQPIDRFLTALPRGNHQIYLSWRLLTDDTPSAPFEVQRRQAQGDWETVSSSPIITSTDFLDTVTIDAVYEYRVISNNQPSYPVQVDASAPPSNLAFEFPLCYPAQKYPCFFAIGDLENNGRYGVVIRESRQGKIQVCAYSLEGKRLWQIDTGLPDAGGWDGRSLHIPCVVYDINGDGRTEVLFHKGAGHAFADNFYDQAGADETLIAVDSETGDTIWEVPWPAKNARVMFTAGYLRGMDASPSIVILDGTYKDVVITAIDGESGQTQWQVEQARPAGHNLDINDVDGDGLMEVIAGGICYRGDGTALWEAEPFGHTDVSKPAKFLPDHAGLQTLYLVEKDNPGVYLVDSQGKTLWHVPFDHAHWSWIGRYEIGGDALMIHAAEKGDREYFPIFYPDGQEWLEITPHQAHRYAAIGWEADGITCFAHRKEKQIVRLDENGQPIPIEGSELPAGTQFGRWQICADLIGDFRENFACVDYEKGTFFVAQNPRPAGKRALSPMEDFNYRHERSQLGSGYYTYIAPPKL